MDLLIIIGWIGVIAYLSFVDGAHTKRSSERLYKIIPIDMYLMRNLAHIIEFFILTTFLFLGNYSIWIAVIVNVLSEALKPFVSKGRHFHFDDVILNSIGIIIAIGICAIFYC